MEKWNNIYSTFDPIAFNLFGIPVHWYGIMYVLALLVALFVAKWIAKKDSYPISDSLLDSYFLWVEIGVILGAITPIAGGNLYTSLGYADYEAADLPAGHAADVEKADYKVYGVGVGYQYPLSKRTYVYTAASYTQETKNDGASATSKDLDTNTTEVMMGLVHNF